MIEFSNSKKIHEKSEWESHFNQTEHFEHSEQDSDCFNNNWRFSNNADFENKQKQCKATKISRLCWKMK